MPDINRLLDYSDCKKNIIFELYGSPIEITKIEPEYIELSTDFDDFKIESVIPGYNFCLLEDQELIDFSYFFLKSEWDREVTDLTYKT